MPANPIEALTDYFGSYNNHKLSELNDLREEVNRLMLENQYIAEQIKEKTEELERKKKEKEEEEAARKLQEEEEAKKKGGKKGAPVPAPGPAKKK